MMPWRSHRERGRHPPDRRGLPTACAIACWVAACGAGRAEDDQVMDVVTAGEAQVRAQRDGGWVELGPTFDRNLFQQTEGFSWTGGRRIAAGARAAAAGPGDSAALATLRTLGANRIARIDAICGLTDQQRRALQLAVESDARRIADEIEAERRKYRDIGVDLRDQEGQKRFQQLQQDVQRCRAALRNPFAARSLLLETLATTLDERQQGLLTADAEARRDALWRGVVAGAMLRMDSLLGLDQRQYEALEALLLERRPRLRTEGFSSRQNVHARQMLAFLVLAEIDPGRLRALVSERQMALLERLTDQGRSMRAIVVAQGLIEDEP